MYDKRDLLQLNSLLPKRANSSHCNRTARPLARTAGAHLDAPSKRLRLTSRAVIVAAHLKRTGGNCVKCAMRLRPSR
jgi:hypothetical protein